MQSLLIIDDEPNVCYTLEKVLGSSRLKILTAGTAAQGVELVRRESPDTVILDLRLPDMSGLNAYRQIRQIDARLPVIIITAHGTTDTAIEATKLGAFDYLLKPLDLEQLRDVVARAVHLSHISRTPAMYDENGPPELESDQLVGNSPPMQELYKSIGRIAPQDVTVLILGESGTGKEMVARAIYQHSRRNRAPLLAINCAAIPETLLESELFGHGAARSPAPTAAASASSNRPTGEPSSWTRWATWRRPPRQNSCGCCKRRSSNAWAAVRRSTPTSA